MMRQRVRRALILASFLFFPATLYYFSPVLIIEGAARGIVVGSFIMFAFQLFVSLFIGRSFCGWACPAAGLQEACFQIQNREVKGGGKDSIKYIIWVSWIATIVFFAVRAGGFSSVDPIYQTRHGLSVTDPIGYTVYFAVVALILVPALLGGRRAFCHYICWMAPFMVIGAKIRNVFKWPALRLKSDRSKCINCKACTKNCPMSLDVSKMVCQGSMINSECVLCGTCVDGCPKGVITYSFSAGVGL